MDNIRFALLCALGVLGFMLFQAWQADYATPPATSPDAHETVSTETAATEDVPSLAVAPDAGTKQTQAAADSAAPAGGADQGKALASGETIRVITDKLKVLIDMRGGDIRHVALLDVPVSADKPKSSLDLINDSLPNFFIVQSGLSGRSAPSHNATFQAKQQTYRMAPGQKVLRVPLVWTDGSGHKVIKEFVFYRGGYRVGLNHKVINNTDEPWKVSQYVRFWRTPFHFAGGIPFVTPFMGVGWYATDTGKQGEYRYESRARGDLAGNPLSRTQEGGWIAMVQHYFVGAVIPPQDARVKIFARPKSGPGIPDDAYASGFISAPKTVAPGQRATLHATLFIGPKLQDKLAAVAPGLELTVDYGWLAILAKPIFWVLEKIHMLVGNWGISIIILTILIKLTFYKLSEKQFRSMARMRKFAPRMQQLKEKYGDDKQKLQSKMMELYKKEGVNPLGGCWPLLIQMPVFVALYWMLRGAVELRLESFLWLPDLTAPDPYYILPVVCGATMFLQQRLQTMPAMDPIQQRMMQVMPVGLAVFFAFFPSGLVLYYCTNNVLSIAQQWYIYRKLDNEGLGHKAPAK